MIKPLSKDCFFASTIDIPPKINKTANKLSWCYEKDYTGENLINATKERPVICLDIKIRYESTMEVTRLLGIPHSTLSSALKNHTKTHGLYFCYEDEIDNWKPRQSNAKKPIICVETNKVYESAREAERQTQIKAGNIFNSLKTGGTAGGYHWKYIDEYLNN